MATRGLLTGIFTHYTFEPFLNAEMMKQVIKQWRNKIQAMMMMTMATTKNYFNNKKTTTKNGDIICCQLTDEGESSNHVEHSIPADSWWETGCQHCSDRSCDHLASQTKCMVFCSWLFSFIHLLAFFFNVKFGIFLWKHCLGWGQVTQPLSAHGGNRTKKMCHYYPSLLQALNMLWQESCQNGKNIWEMRP